MPDEMTEEQIIEQVATGIQPEATPPTPPTTEQPPTPASMEPVTPPSTPTPEAPKVEKVVTPPEDPVRKLEQRIVELQNQIIQLNLQGKQVAEPAKTKEPPKRKWTPKNEDMDALVIGGEQAAKVLTQMYDAALEDAQERILSQVNQSQAYAEEAKKREVEFVASHPDLKEWLPEAREVANYLLNQAGKQYATWQDFYADIALHTKQLVERYTKRGAPQTPPAVTPPPPVDKTPARPPVTPKLIDGNDEESLIRAVVKRSR